MRYEIRLAGFGGQGIITAGRLLALAIMESNPEIFIVYSPSYGFQTRGGDAISDIIVSNEEIDYPKAKRFDVAVILTQPAYNKYCNYVKDDGLLIIDEHINRQTQCSNKRHYALDIIASARNLGGDVLSSSIILGILTYHLERISLFKGKIKLDVVKQVVTRYFRESLIRREAEEVISRNIKALELGYGIMSKITIT